MKHGIPEFATKKETFNYLIANKSAITKLKKATVKACDSFGRSIFEKNIVTDIQQKAASTTVNKDTADSIYRTIVANTYGWIDSHEDMHVPGIFTKSIQENQGNFFHLHDHLFRVTAKVGIIQKVYEEQISWASLGVNLTGNTTALLVDTNIQKALNEQVFDQYESGQINQHSVGMIYVKMALCINDPSYKEEYASWNTYYPMVGNKAIAVQEGYFWAITEAKLVEISCVLKGSNELTPMIEPDDDDIESSDNLETIQPEQSTGTNKIEPEQSTQKYTHNPNLF